MHNTTNVTTEAMDLSDLFPDVPEIKESTLFSKETDAVNLDDVKDDDDPEKSKTKDIKPADDKSTDDKSKVIQVIKPIVSHETPDLGDLNTKEFDDAKSGNRSGLIEFFKEKIESGDIIPFSDFDESKSSLDDYLKGFKNKDFDELWKSNIEQKEKDIAAKLPQEFFQSLPPELRYAAQYANDGGTDFKQLFKVLGQVEEVKALDPIKDARKVVEQYLTAKAFGTDEEIKEQLDEWDDLGVIEKKSQNFKPQLDKMEEDIVKQKLAKQADIKKQQVDQYNFYHNSVVDAIKDEDLNGIKIDKKIQSMIYSGLTQDSFVDSRNKRCTEFEFLLDEIMWTKPDYKKLAKVYWMLKDDSVFETALSNKAVNKNVEETIRTLKTEQSKKGASAIDTPETVKRRVVQRSNSLFKR